MKLKNEIKLGKPYISVDGSFGGNQGWFLDIDNAKKGKTLKGWGCGLIAASDVLNYVTSGDLLRATLEKEAAKNTAKEEKNVNSFGKDDYLKFVMSMEKKFFHILPKLGVSGIMLSLGANIYFLLNWKKIRNATGHSYLAHWFVRPSKLLDSIRQMLTNEIPVIIAIGPGFFRKDKVVFYDRKEIGGAIHFKPLTKTKDHYVTVTGMLETDDRILLEISSWGKKYYMDYGEYVSYVKKCDNFYFSNILYIKRF
ncbi:MAG: hypothetical protein K6E10_04165 [Eubacterium sp.]|nr:hypothetical protein [Eubacterium sp.]